MITLVAWWPGSRCSDSLIAMVALMPGSPEPSFSPNTGLAEHPWKKRKELPLKQICLFSDATLKSSWHWRRKPPAILKLFAVYQSNLDSVQSSSVPKRYLFLFKCFSYSNWVISGPTTLLSSAAVLHLKKVNLVWGHMAALQVAQRQISAESPALFVDICSDWRNEAKMHREALGNWSWLHVHQKDSTPNCWTVKNKVMATIIIFLSYFAMKTFTKKESQ